jgi:phosphoglycerate dehydrogenase-like enzyme
VPCEDAEALAAALAQADALVTRRVDVGDALLRGAGCLKLVQQVGTGTDRIDLAAIERHGVALSNTPGAPSNAVVEHSFLLMLAALRDLPRQVDSIRGGGWSGTEVWEGGEIAGSTLGIVGFGAIGSGIARRALAFEATVIATTRTIPCAPWPAVEFVDLKTLLRRSDILVLAPALTPRTRGMIGAAELALMKPSALLVNVSRGAVVDEAALIDALQGGRLRGAALDAFVTEPLPPESMLRRMPQVIATPHSAGSSRQSRARIWAQIVENLARLADGRMPKNIVAGAVPAP